MGGEYKVAFAIGTMYYTHIHRTHIVTKTQWVCNKTRCFVPKVDLLTFIRK